MDEEDIADDSLYIIPDNHPLIVLSDDEDHPEENVTAIKTEKIDARIKQENDDIKLKREKKADEKEGIKKEKDLDVLPLSKAVTDTGVRKRTIKNEEETKCKRMKLEKSNDTEHVPKTTAKKERVGLKGVRKPTAKTDEETEPVTNFDFNACENDGPGKLGSGIQWEASMLSREADIPVIVAKNVITMLNNECTVPFIARYRRDRTGNMDADDLRRVKDCYHHIKNLETKTLNALKQIKSSGKLTPKLEEMLLSVRSADELDFIYAPYKKGSSKTRAERARALGLEEVAMHILVQCTPVNVDQYINPEKEGLKNRDQVIEGIQNIMADAFAKEEDMLTYLSAIENRIHMTIKSRLIKKPSPDKAENKEKDKKTSNEDTEKKFEIYYDFTANVNHIQPHQILALNRGENLKILSVKLIITDWLETELLRFFERKWVRGNYGYQLREKLFKNSFHDSYSRLISPFLIRRTKTALNRKAQYAAIESFANNLKSLLQTPPVKGCAILGIDPGFRHGSKFALISKNGDVIWTRVFRFELNHVSSDDEKYLRVIRDRLVENKCELVAIGNGTGCRGMEKVFSTYIKKKFFEPYLNVQYTIVNERGASIYSCSSVAKEEFPDLDPNLVSAVFIARSLQDPLNEYVKVEPKHLGVGMYQHDMPEKQLDNTLDEVVEQCVSFVGVDLNTASIHLLKRIAGLSLARAKNIIEWRQKNGSLKNRLQLLKVKGIGSKTYEQCCGFVRIYPSAIDETELRTEKRKAKTQVIVDDYNPLDSTCIHPESYQLAEDFIERCELDIQELGAQTFIEKLRKVVDKEGITKLATELNQPVTSISLITEALMQPLDYDYRNQFSKPVFRQCQEDINSLRPGMLMTGVVGNVTHFGAFVDIGVGRSGLIHTSGMNGYRLQVGNKVEVKVLEVQPERNRISLFLLRKC